MASSDFLRKNKNQHTVKNSISKLMDSDISSAVDVVMDRLQRNFPMLTFEHKSKMMLSDITNAMGARYPQFRQGIAKVMETSFIKPDGGFLYAIDKNGNRRLILVAEVKRQGTNDKRLTEGLKKQARGNAIERLGKNLIGIRGLFKEEDIIPFVCFGSGDDFSEGSSILDRVVTMNEHFPLGKIFIRKDYLPFEPVSMLFRPEKWTTDEMANVMETIAVFSIRHYFAK